MPLQTDVNVLSYSSEVSAQNNRILIQFALIPNLFHFQQNFASLSTRTLHEREEIWKKS